MARPPAPRGGLRALTTRLGRDVRALATPGGVRGAVVESLWVTAHVATYPWGLLRERRTDDERYGYEGLRPLQRGLLIRDVETAGTPILLLHGMIDNRAIFTLLTRRLRAHGFTRVRTLNYSPTTNDIRAAAENLAAEVEALVAESGHERIHVVGHSLGGLIARYYVQRLGGDARVRTLVTLGTPHHGTLAAHLVPARLGRQLRPGSDLYRELDLPAPGFATRVVAYWSDLDQLIVPHDNARLAHPDLCGPQRRRPRRRAPVAADQRPRRPPGGAAAVRDRRGGRRQPGRRRPQADDEAEENTPASPGRPGRTRSPRASPPGRSAAAAACRPRSRKSTWATALSPPPSTRDHRAQAERVVGDPVARLEVDDLAVARASGRRAAAASRRDGRALDEAPRSRRVSLAPPVDQLVRDLVEEPARRARTPAAPRRLRTAARETYSRSRARVMPT